MTTTLSSFDSKHEDIKKSSLMVENSIPEKKVNIVCELCEKVFPNRVQKSNHKLLVHTVRAEILKCDYCSEEFEGLKNLCKHISHAHSELFPKRRGNQCYICSKIFSTIEETTNHMDESHSPDSFYEQIKDDIVERPKSTKYDNKVIKPEYKVEEVKIVDIVNKDSITQARKKS